MHDTSQYNIAEGKSFYLRHVAQINGHFLLTAH